MIKPLEFHPQPNQPNHFYHTNCTKRTNNKVTTAPSTSFRGHLLYQLKTNLSSISMLTPPAHPSNNPPSLLYANPNQLINPTQFCFSPHPKIFSANLIQVFFLCPLMISLPLLPTTPITLQQILLHLQCHTRLLLFF